MGEDDVTAAEMDHYLGFQKLRKYYYKMLSALDKSMMDMGPDDIESIEDQITACKETAQDSNEEAFIREARLVLNSIINKLAISSRQSLLNSGSAIVDTRTYEERLTYSDKNSLRAMRISPDK